MSHSSLADFSFECTLGKGSFGTVYRVKRLVDNNTYVLKQIPLGSLSAKEQNECITEVNLLAAVESEYIVKYYDSFIDNSCLNIVMEYCSHGDLQQKLKRQKNVLLSENVIWGYFIQTLLGILSLHQRKILHRDVKCANLFLTENTNANVNTSRTTNENHRAPRGNTDNELLKIGDLGVAKMLSSQSAFASTSVGTPYYLSPELCEGKPYNEKSDVWACAIVLYELCTLRHPFDASNQGALILKILRGRYDPLPSCYAATKFQRVLDAMLRKDTATRPTIAQVLASTGVYTKMKELGFEVPHVVETIVQERKRATVVNTNNGNATVGGVQRIDTTSVVLPKQVKNRTIAIPPSDHHIPSHHRPPSNTSSTPSSSSNVTTPTLPAARKSRIRRMGTSSAAPNRVAANNSAITVISGVAPARATGGMRLPGGKGVIAKKPADTKSNGLVQQHPAPLSNDTLTSTTKHITHDEAEESFDPSTSSFPSFQLSPAVSELLASTDVTEEDAGGDDGEDLIDTSGSFEDDDGVKWSASEHQLEQEWREDGEKDEEEERQDEEEQLYDDEAEEQSQHLSGNKSASSLHASRPVSSHPLKPSTTATGTVATKSKPTPMLSTAHFISSLQQQQQQHNASSSSLLAAPTSYGSSLRSEYSDDFDGEEEEEEEQRRQNGGNTAREEEEEDEEDYGVEDIPVEHDEEEEEEEAPSLPPPSAAVSSRPATSANRSSSASQIRPAVANMSRPSTSRPSSGVQSSSAGPASSCITPIPSSSPSSQLNAASLRLSKLRDHARAIRSELEVQLGIREYDLLYTFFAAQSNTSGGDSPNSQQQQPPNVQRILASASAQSSQQGDVKTRIYQILYLEEEAAKCQEMMQQQQQQQQHQQKQRPLIKTSSGNSKDTRKDEAKSPSRNQTPRVTHANTSSCATSGLNPTSNLTMKRQAMMQQSTTNHRSTVTKGSVSNKSAVNVTASAVKSRR